MKTGFIGLGHLGKTMAKRLIAEGADLSVWNRTREKAADMGVPVAGSPSKLISAVDIVFLNLFDSNAVMSVLSESDGLLEGECRGKLIVDTTTNHFENVRSFHKIVEERGGHYLEAPVLGSLVPASQGTLTVLVSGAKEAYEKALPLIGKIGKEIFYLGEPALATRMKLINNLVLGSFMATLSEAVAFGEAAGIGKEQVIGILSAGAGNSAILNAKKEKLLKEDFSAHFTSALMYKDLHYMQDLAKALKKPCFTAAVPKELFAATFSKNMDHLDFSVVYKLLKEY